MLTTTLIRVFTINETITATSAPHANASASSHDGSGSYRSSHTSGIKYKTAGTKATIAASTAGIMPTLANNSIITTSERNITANIVTAIPMYLPVFGGSGLTPDVLPR